MLYNLNFIEEEAEETGRTTPNKSGSNLRDPSKYTYQNTPILTGA